MENRTTFRDYYMTLIDMIVSMLFDYSCKSPDGLVRYYIHGVYNMRVDFGQPCYNKRLEAFRLSTDVFHVKAQLLNWVLVYQIKTNFES